MPSPMSPSAVQAPYIPPRDTDLDSWAANFSSMVTADPGVYGLNSTDAAEIESVVDAWHVAYLAAIAPSTRTPVTISAKDTARNTMVPVLRQFAQIVRVNPSVDDSDKLALGINLTNTVRQPIPAPSTSPILSVIGATPGQHTLRFADQNTPDRRALAAGASQLQLFALASSTPITDPEDLAYLGSFTKQPLAANWPNPADRGRVAYYAARWVTKRGLHGPWSTIVSLTIA